MSPLSRFSSSFSSHLTRSIRLKESLLLLFVCCKSHSVVVVVDHRSCQLQAPSSSAAAVTSIGSLEDQFAPYAPRFAAHSSSPSPGHQDLYLCSTHAILCSLIFSPVPREHPIVHSSSSSSSPSRQREGRCYMGLKMFCIVKLYLLDIFVVFDLAFCNT